MLKELTTDQIISLAFIGFHTSGIAHNINTPLSAIMGRIELLKMRLDKIEAGTVMDDELEKCLNDLSVISQCCVKIDESLKTCVKTSHGILQSRTCAIRLDSLLQGMLAFLDADMDYKHQIAKSFDFQNEIPAITGNPADFAAAFFEILNNCWHAMQHSPEKKLSVSMSSAEDRISIIVRDSGCGMEESGRQSAERLLQGRAEEQGRESGLQRVGRLLRPYGARFDIQSRPGETIFEVRLPVHI